MPETAPEPLLLTEHEILALLTLNDTESARTTRKVLRLPDAADESDYMRAGVSTLVVRNHAVVGDEDVTAQGVARSVASVMTTAGEWLEIGIATNEHSHVYFAISSVTGSVLASLNTLGVHELLPLDPKADLLETGLHIVKNALADDDTAKPVAVNVTHYGFGHPPATASVLADADGRWYVAAEPRDQQGDLTKTEVDGGQALMKLSDALVLDERH